MTNDTTKTSKIKNGDNTFTTYRQNVDCCETIITILADRTNGHAYATVLRLSVIVCRLSVTCVLWLNGAS